MCNKEYTHRDDATYGGANCTEGFRYEIPVYGGSPPEARRLFLNFIWLKHLLARSDKQLNDEQIELAPHDCK